MDALLNPSQQAAVDYCDGPSLVIAGAGSGKTRVLTFKIAHLLSLGYQPWSILALTFTNKAAREMQERIARQVGEEPASRLWMGTFHSIFARILRIESAAIGFTSNFTIYDADDARNLQKAIVREMQLDEKVYAPHAVASRISFAKNNLSMPPRSASDGSLPQLPEIARRYQQRLLQANAMDFDDLLLSTFVLFRDHPEVLAKYQERFRYVLVDEYQDTNYAQHQIILQLTHTHQHLCVVGDDAQSIYSFRGANIDNILHFQQQYPTARLFKLEQNYRSTPQIVAAANSLIRHNAHQIPKDVFSHNPAGSPIKVTRAYSDSDEAETIVRQAMRYQRDSHIPLGQMAVLYRTNAQSRSFEEVLRRHRVAYRIYGGTSFYQRAEVKNIIAYLRLAVNPQDEEALRRVINYPTRGIGKTTVQRLFALASERSVSPWQMLGEMPADAVQRGTLARLDAFRNLIESFHEQAPLADAYTLALLIVRQSGAEQDIMQGTDPEDISRQQNLQELLNGISAFVQEHTEAGTPALLTHYLQEVSLLSDLDEDPTDTADKLTLMTIHSAKGLEFDVVFVCGLEENLIPGERAAENPRQTEEERRLLYVAMTRARLHLHLTFARSRFRNGHLEFSRPSRFLDEIDSLSQRSAAPQRAPRPVAERQAPTTLPPRFVPVSRLTASASASAPSPSEAAAIGKIRPGVNVVHQRFGAGKVTKLEGNGIDAKATVEFQNAGVKVLLLRFARLTVVE